MNNYSIVLLLCLSLPYISQAQQTDKLYLIGDGRQSLERIDQSSWATHPAILQASDQAKNYWLEQNSVYEDDFRIMASTEGNFTRPESKQTAVLYLLSLWPRCCSNMGLAIIENEQLIRNIVFAGGTHHLYSVADINKDGLDELALISGFGIGGSNETTLSLISLDNSSTTLLGRFPLVEENCATLSEHSEHNSFRILFDENSPDEFKLEHYHSGCDEPTVSEIPTSVSNVLIEAVDLKDDYIDLPIH
ncbi:MAG: hypothetical protein E8F57_03410 [Methylophaga nitratireducenticrescens]|uniref:hypothetical protein n=1 Tax=Methylophaga sp. SB9B TaxID=2570356 RepID=UPI0010A8B9B4|nr:hypothetical protein [Methylophaga sp. SB9B]THF68317.1 MAG: hypothetical protein E8F57_03410 [Methylophaga nitratireducenticrescens]THK40843.1 hypothetical protein E8Q33_11140 [Methylophaga sp. SB9B]